MSQSAKERILLLLQEQGRTSNRRLRTSLDLPDDRYAILRRELLEQQLVEKVKGQGGGLQLTPNGLKKKVALGAKSSVENERALYAPFVKTLREEIAENEEAAIVIDTSALRNIGKWSNPDVTTISIRKFPILRSHKVLLTTYELKQWKRWNIDSVFEAASQRRFAHEAYVVLEWAKQEPIVGLDDMIAVCSRFGVGLLTLHPYFSKFRYAVQLEAEKNSVSEDYVEEYLSYVFEKNGSALAQYDLMCQGQGV